MQSAGKVVAQRLRQEPRAVWDLGSALAASTLNNLAKRRVAQFDLPAPHTSPASAEAACNLLKTAVQEKQRLDAKRLALTNARTELADRYKEQKHLADPARDEQARTVKAQLKADFAACDSELTPINHLIDTILTQMPNQTHPDVPVGGYNACRVVASKQSPVPVIPQPLDHLALCKKYNMFDLEAAADISGPSFYFLKNDGALLEMALVQYAMSFWRKRNYVPVLVPDIVRQYVLSGCGYSAKDQESQQYQLASPNTGKYLIATAEIPLVGLHANKQLKNLPLRYVAFSHCFRAEAGNYGKEVRGLYRVHQFSKVEAFAVTVGDTTQSEAMLAEMLAIEQELFDSLGLGYRVMEMSTEELGAPAYHKYDIEAWMPGRNNFGEISSASNCTDFQTRRLEIRDATSSKDPEHGHRFAHTVNATACAVPRMIIAILETYQQTDGRVQIPEVLQKYFDGRTHFE